MPINSELYYIEKSSTVQYSCKETGILDPGRLAQGLPDYWQKPISTQLNMKTLILADWWAENWDRWKRFQVKIKLAELQKQGHTIYIWQNPFLTLLDDVEILDQDPICRKITPEFKCHLYELMFNQHRLTQNQVYIIQHRELMLLLGYPKEELNLIRAEYLNYTIHDVHLIKQLQQLDSEPALTHAIIDKIEKIGIKQSIPNTWSELTWENRFDHIYLEKCDQITTDETNQVLIYRRHNQYPISHDIKVLHIGFELPVNVYTMLLKTSIEFLHLKLEEDSNHDYLSFQLPNLKYLSVECENGFTESFNTLLLNTPNIEVLEMNVYKEACNFNIEKRPALDHLKQLKYLIMGKIAPEDIQYILRSLPDLQFLSVEKTSFTKVNRIILETKLIQTIELSQVIINAQNLAVFAGSCKNLRLEDVTFDGDITLDQVTFNQLESLTISNLDHVDDGIEYSVYLPPLLIASKYLKKLNITNPEYFDLDFDYYDDDLFYDLSFPDLNTLSVSNSYTIDLPNLIKQCPKLNSLTLDNAQLIHFSCDNCLALSKIQQVHLKANYDQG